MHYSWRARPECAREHDDAVLLARIRAIFETSDHTYGSPLVTNALREEGFALNEKRIAPNQVYVGDITYALKEGWVSLAIFLGLFTRKIVGFAMQDHMRTELVIEALRKLFHSSKTELVYRRDFNTREEAKQATFKWIETWDNREQLHSSLSYMAPEKFEKLALAA